MERKAKQKKNGNNIQYNLCSLLIAKIRKYTPNKEKKAEWWSAKGVPLDGYASTDTKSE